MTTKFPDLHALIQNDTSAKKYYDSLPEYIREHIATRAHNVNSIESLKDYAENLLRGDI